MRYSISIFATASIAIASLSSTVLAEPMMSHHPMMAHHQSMHDRWMMHRHERMMHHHEMHRGMMLKEPMHDM